MNDLPIRRRTSQTPPPDNQGGRTRLLIMGFGMLVAFVVLTARLYDLQITYQRGFELQARRNSLVERKIPAPRGLIYDRNGEVLVRNAPAFQVAIIPARQYQSDNLIERRVKRMEIYHRLAQMIDQPGVTAGDIYTKVYAKIQQARPYDRVVIADNVPREKALIIQEQALTMPGVVVQSVGSRTYPYKELLGNILGYIGRIPAGQETTYEQNGYDRDDRVGLAGIEFVAEEQLRGVKGREVVLVDASGEELRREGEPVPPREGYGVRLTLDMRLQKIISDALIPAMQLRNAPRAAVVALNPKTGEVLGMVTVPGYDNNLFVQGISQKQWQALQEDLHNPLLNHATDDLVPPGSTFKIVTVAALLEEGAVTPYTMINDPGTFTLPDQYDPENPDKGQKFYCWIALSGNGQHGPQNISDALRNSCDTYFYKAVGGYAPEGIVGMGPDKLAKWMGIFGIGEPSGLEIGFGRGFAPTPAWKRNTFGDVWTTGDSYNMSIGQGYVLATPLEMARVVAAIANDGVLMQAQIVREIVDAEGNTLRPFEPKVTHKLPISEATLRLIQQSLIDVVSDRGTARMSQIPGFQYAGKTGTAEFCDDVAIKTGVCYTGIKYLPTHAWFVAYAPATDPRLALAVYVWNGGQGSGVAAPIAQRIIAGYFNIPLENPAPIQKSELE
ncbi:MAG: penicillin-binding protein 2 [Anaerolineae bacterium]|nr:penicillin-binding protein 2 [Thermoflexales bacterium]MDW8408224.1 penicillin-binding protein 2 [Anaerolineae bacterium]